MTSKPLWRVHWPYGFRAALLVIPYTLVLLLLALLVGGQWVHWPEDALRPHVISLGAVLSFLPLMLVLIGRATEPHVPALLAAGSAANDTESSFAPPRAEGARADRGSAVRVTNYETFCEGDFEPYLGKRIHFLTYKSERFIVYLDQDLAVQWACAGHFDLAPEVGRVFNRVAEMTALPVEHLAFQYRLAFRTLVAESVARVLRDRPDVSAPNMPARAEEGVSAATPDRQADFVANTKADAEAAHDALDRALAFYTARSIEKGRWWYLTASVVAALALLVIVLSLWSLRSWFESRIGTSAFDVTMGAGAGAAGALLSVLFGSRKHTPNTATQRNIHLFEGAARILAGSVGAVLMALAIKGNFMLGQIAPTADSKELFLFLCMVAGWSERLVPNLIERFEAMQAAPTVGSRPTR